MNQILSQAGAEPARWPEKVCNYVISVLNVLVAFEMSCDLIDHPGRGYSLEFPRRQSSDR